MGHEVTPVDLRAVPRDTEHFMERAERILNGKALDGQHSFEESHDYDLDLTRSLPTPDDSEIDTTDATRELKVETIASSAATTAFEGFGIEVEDMQPTSTGDAEKSEKTFEIRGFDKVYTQRDQLAERLEAQKHAPEHTLRDRRNFLEGSPETGKKAPATGQMIKDELNRVQNFRNDLARERGEIDPATGDVLDLPKIPIEKNNAYKGLLTKLKPDIQNRLGLEYGEINFDRVRDENLLGQAVDNLFAECEASLIDMTDTLASDKSSNAIHIESSVRLDPELELRFEGGERRKVIYTEKNPNEWFVTNSVHPLQGLSVARILSYNSGQIDNTYVTLDKMKPTRRTR